MHRHLWGKAGLLFIALWPGMAKAQSSIDGMLKPYLAKYDLPALAAAVVKDGKVIAAGAVGTRKYGADIPVTLNDRFHLGSDTKAMTSLMVGMMVEEGKLRWDSTMGELFPELVDTMEPSLRKVTIERLLSHTSGIPSDNATFDDIISKATLHPGNLDEQRVFVVKEWVKQKLVSEPGSKFAYANMNYILAGAILEKLTRRTWDELIVERVFTPLDLKTAGLGPQSSMGRIDAPLGHMAGATAPRPMLAGPNGDNPLVLGPAGIAHMSILDFARWAGWNAGRGKRGPQLVKKETLARLQTKIISLPDRPDAPPGTPGRGGYGLGWGTMPVGWAAYPLISHAGSNTMNLAQVWLDPDRDVALVLVTNIGGKKADDAFRALSPELYKIATNGN